MINVQPGDLVFRPDPRGNLTRVIANCEKSGTSTRHLNQDTTSNHSNHSNPSDHSNHSHHSNHRAEASTMKRRHSSHCRRICDAQNIRIIIQNHDTRNPRSYRHDDQSVDHSRNVSVGNVHRGGIRNQSGGFRRQSDGSEIVINLNDSAPSHRQQSGRRASINESIHSVQQTNVDAIHGMLHGMVLGDTEIKDYKFRRILDAAYGVCREIKEEPERETELKSLLGQYLNEIRDRQRFLAQQRDQLQQDLAKLCDHARNL